MSSHSATFKKTLPSAHAIDVIVAGKQTWGSESVSATLTNGADYTGVACCDWLLVNVQQTEMLQESVGHACIQLLVLDKGVRLWHHLRVTPDTSCSGGGKNVVRGVKSDVSCHLHLQLREMPPDADHSRGMKITYRAHTHRPDIKHSVEGSWGFTWWHLAVTISPWNENPEVQQIIWQAMKIHLTGDTECWGYVLGHVVKLFLKE